MSKARLAKKLAKLDQETAQPVHRPKVVRVASTRPRRPAVLPERPIRVPNDRLLERVVREHRRYIAAGGIVTFDLLIDPALDLNHVTDLLIKDKFDSWLAKIGKGQNLEQLCRNTVRYCRRPRSIMATTSATAGTITRSAKVKPQKVRRPRQRHIVMKSPFMAVVVSSRNDTPSALRSVRAAFHERLAWHDYWQGIIDDDNPANNERMLSALREKSERSFMAKLEKQVGSRDLLIQNLKTVFGEIRRNRIIQVPAQTKREVTRDVDHPRRISGMTRL